MLTHVYSSVWSEIRNINALNMSFQIHVMISKRRGLNLVQKKLHNLKIVVPVYGSRDCTPRSKKVYYVIYLLSKPEPTSLTVSMPKGESKHNVT